MTKQKDLPQDRRGLVTLLRATAGRHGLYDVFRDFCEMAAISVSNAVDLLQREAHEKRYLDLAKKYTADELARFPEMLGCLVGELENGYADVLGSTFMELELENKSAGQFFTPYEVCKVMARMTLDDALKAEIAAKGYITVNDPATGGGATLIAFAEAVREAGFNPQTQIHVTAQDVDPRAVHMTYLHLSLLNIPAAVILGNTIALETREVWYTPAHILGGWNWKLKDKMEARVTKEPVNGSKGIVEHRPKTDVTMPSGEQIGLFPEVA